MAWSPAKTANGWWPRLSPDGAQVLYGTGGEAWQASWRTGVEQKLDGGGGRVYPLGWASNAPLAAYVPPRPVEDPVRIYGQVYPSLNLAPYSGDAWGGSWCAAQAGAPSKVWFNGLQIPPPISGWKCRCDGAIMTVASRDGITIYTNGVPTAFIPCGEVAQHFTRNGYIGASMGGKAWVAALHTTVMKVVTVAPLGRESAPIVVEGWVWNVIENVYGKTYIQGHSLESPEVIIRERPSGSQSWIDVVRVSGEWIVASCHDRGILVVEAIPITERPRLWEEILVLGSISRLDQRVSELERRVALLE